MFQPKVVISQLAFFNWGAFPQQYTRPLTLTITPDQVTNVQKAITGMRSPSPETDQVDPTTVVPFLQGILQPQVEAVAVKLPTNTGRSWAGGVASFLACFEVETPVSTEPRRFYVSGYTDPIEDGKIDPQAHMFINSIHELSEWTFPGELGMPITKTEMASSQVLADNNFEGFFNNGAVRIRPQEVMRTLHVLTDPMLASGVSTFTDTRSSHTNAPALSQYQHNDPIEWLQMFFGAYMCGRDAAAAMNHSGILDSLQHGVRFTLDPSARLNAVLRTLAHLHGGELSNAFTLNDLLVIDPSLTNKLVINYPGESAIPPESYATFDKNDVTTVTANYFNNSVTALMAKHGISRASVQASSQYEDAAVVSSCYTIDRCVDEETIQKFEKDLKLQVLDVISHNGLLSYTVDATFNLHGKSFIAMSCGNEPSRNYRIPTFANSLFSPLVVANQEALTAMTKTMDQLLRDLAIPARLKPLQDFS